MTAPNRRRKNHVLDRVVNYRPIPEITPQQARRAAVALASVGHHDPAGLLRALDALDIREKVLPRSETS